jgi:prophage maintenance system killer protein
MRLEMKTTLFGVLKDSGFDSAIGQIQQGLGDQDIYPSMEEKAAILLYLIVKNHAFVDGNKRIGAACFLHFLNQNNALFDPFGQSIISNEALASLTLLVATSRNDEMQTIKRLIMSILNRSNFVT